MHINIFHWKCRTKIWKWSMKKYHYQQQQQQHDPPLQRKRQIVIFIIIIFPSLPSPHDITQGKGMGRDM